jgi:hypothetical protein
MLAFPGKGKGRLVQTPILLALLLGTAQAPAATPAAQSVEADFAEVTSRICYPIVNGERSFAFADVDAEMKAVQALGLRYGIPRIILESLPRTAQTAVSRATLGARANGAYHTLFALRGTVPGCKVLLTGPADAALTGRIADAFATKAGGWTRRPDLDRRSGAVERRSFARRDNKGVDYLLDLLIVHSPEHGLRLLAMVALLPPSLAVPPTL